VLKSKFFEILKFLLGWPISLISLYFVFKFLAPKSSQIISSTHPNPIVIFFSIICFIAYSISRAIIWQNLLANKKYNIPFKKTFYFWISSEFKRYTPGNIWSFLGRSFSFRSLSVKQKDIFQSLVLESELVILGSLLVSLIALPFVFNILPNIKFELFAQPAIFFLAVFIASIFVFSRKLIFPKFNYLINLKLLGCAFVTFLLFGIGSYLSTASLFYINPRDFLVISGYFSLALLIGYLSIITPMGLGVREAVLFFGLTRILPIEQAAFAALFARVVFIVSELISLAFAWTWERSKKFPFEEYIKKNLHLIILLILILAYVVYFTNTTFLRHDNFYTGRFDLGNMDQTVWNTVHGRIFQLTNPNGTNITSRLSFHADFLLVLLAPFYWFWRDPKALLFLQSLILPLGAIFVYLISEKIIKNKNFSFVLAACFLINPAVNHSNIYDFHPVVLGTTFLLGAFYFMKVKKDFLFIVFLILAGLTKENVWVLTALFGLYAIFFEKRKLLGTIIFLSSTLIFIYLVLIVMPHFAGGKNFALSYYSDFGDSPLLIVKNALLNPIKTFSLLIKMDRLIYIKDLFLPFAFLPILSPLVIFTLPSLFINMLSNNSLLYNIIYQYTATVTPFLFIATIYAVKWISGKTPMLKMGFYTTVILLFSLYSAYDFGPLPGARIPNIEMYTHPLQNRAVVENYIDRISIRYSLATTNNLGAHLSHRRRIYTVPVGIDEADAILFLLRGSDENSNVIAEKKAYLKVKSDPNYQKVFEDGKFIVFKKKPLI